MARFLVKASEFKNVCKAVNDRKLAELKKEIIEILKKQDEKEVKKAVDYFDSQELHYTHLEKSLNGKWIEKAGYGIGTVRIWKGKKYKKIAPGKWARVFEKEGRGTNVAVGRLIAQIGKIDNIEDLEKFVAANKQRFVDENGADLPVVEKIKAAADSRNGNVGSKTVSKPSEKKSPEKLLKEMGFETMEKVSFNGDKWEVAGVSLDYNGNANGISLTPDRQAGNLHSSNVTVFDIDKIQKNKSAEKKKTFKQEMNELYDAQDKAWEGFESGSEIKSTPENSKKFYDRVKKFVEENNIKLTEKHRAEIEDQNGHSFNEALALAGAYGEDEKEKTLARNKENSKKYKGMVLDLSQIDEFKEKETSSLVDLKEDYWSDYSKKKAAEKEGYWSDEFKERASNNLKNKIAEMKEQGKSDNQIKNELNEKIRKLTQDSDYKKDSIKVGRVQGINRNSFEDGIRHNDVLIENAKEELDKLESESEKTQNRSDAMKGNKNAYKGMTDEKLVKIRESFQTSGKRSKYFEGMTKEEIDSSLDDLFEELDKRNLRNVDSDSMKGNKNAVKVGGEKDVIGTFTKSDDGSVEMPANKEVKELFNSLKKAKSSDDETRLFMTEVYYDGDNIVTTDGRRLVSIKAGDIGLDKGYVKVDTENGKIKVTPLPEITKDYQFPNYQKVIPVNNNQEVKLNNKALKDKLIEMKKEGAYTKDKPFITLEFEDGKILLDGTVVGTGDVDFGDEEKFINFNAQYLTDASLSGDNASMFISDDPNKAVSISTNNSDTVIMPVMQNEGKMDYSENRAAKEKEKSEKAEKLSKNRERNESLIKESIKDIDGQVERVYSHVDNKISSFSDEELKRNYDILNLNMDKIMDRSVDFPSKVVDKKTNASFATAYAYSKLKEKHPDVKDKFLAELEKRGISVKKSLFDDLFEIDIIAADELEDEEELEENETEYNDYTAEQPELFNSPEFAVREALNRRFNCR